MQRLESGGLSTHANAIQLAEFSESLDRLRRVAEFPVDPRHPQQSFASNDGIFATRRFVESPKRARKIVLPEFQLIRRGKRCLVRRCSWRYGRVVRERRSRPIEHSVVPKDHQGRTLPESAGRST